MQDQPMTLTPATLAHIVIEGMKPGLLKIRERIEKLEARLVQMEAQVANRDKES